MQQKACCRAPNSRYSPSAVACSSSLATDVNYIQLVWSVFFNSTSGVVNSSQVNTRFMCKQVEDNKFAAGVDSPSKEKSGGESALLLHRLLEVLFGQVKCAKAKKRLPAGRFSLWISQHTISSGV